MNRVGTSTRTKSSTLSEVIPFVEWEAFLERFMSEWAPNTGGQAEHVSMVGPTKQGKTTLALALLKERVRMRDSAVVVLGTKPKDPTLTRLGWPVVRTWPPGYGKEQVIFWPRFGDVRTAAMRQRIAFEPMLAEVFAEGRRTVYIDEAAYFSQLRLDPMLMQYWQQGRSVDLLVMAGTQRPSRVPRAMWSECSWFFAFRTPDEDELKRVGEIGGTDARLIRETVRSLPPHEFLCVRTRTGDMMRSKVRR
jgi:hypothetical protein